MRPNSSNYIQRNRQWPVYGKAQPRYHPQRVIRRKKTPGPRQQLGIQWNISDRQYVVDQSTEHSSGSNEFSKSITLNEPDDQSSSPTERPAYEQAALTPKDDTEKPNQPLSPNSAGELAAPTKCCNFGQQQGHYHS